MKGRPTRNIFFLTGMASVDTQHLKSRALSEDNDDHARRFTCAEAVAAAVLQLLLSTTGRVGFVVRDSPFHGFLVFDERPLALPPLYLFTIFLWPLPLPPSQCARRLHYFFLF